MLNQYPLMQSTLTEYRKEDFGFLRALISHSYLRIVEWNIKLRLSNVDICFMCILGEERVKWL